ncbi:MAG: hypothetical protein PUC39_06155 [Lachnospiraceae bacterium]|nr:hypothetical protein [Lachnospiraceae bacterium]
MIDVCFFCKKELKSYTLSYQLSGEDTWTTFATGTKNIEEDVLGRLDTTTMENGVYKIRLLAEDFGGNRKTITRKIIVDGNLKLGVISTVEILL